MGKKFEYTTLAYRHTVRFPLLSYTVKQVQFWIIANLLLVTILHLQSLAFSDVYQIPLSIRLDIMLVMGSVIGLVSGVCLGITGYYQERRLFRSQSLGKVIIYKTLTSLSVLIVLGVFTRYILFDLLIIPALNFQRLSLSESSWQYIALLLIIYYFFISLIINFINQVNMRYGPGVVVPLLLGRYRIPREEERIFLFMDLKSSTSTAEKLGHLLYSAFIRDCFSDINEVLYPFRAQVYQYVGDEIVVTWPETEGIKQHFCIRFYFAVKNQFASRAEYYLRTYGTIPEFKAGVHAGTVTSVEIGELKRDIAYHGDTLNTAARIQSLCNELSKSFIISKYLIDKVGLPANIRLDPIGLVRLKGKAESVELFSIELTG